jgi:hypothetical protein
MIVLFGRVLSKIDIRFWQCRFSKKIPQLLQSLSFRRQKRTRIKKETKLQTSDCHSLIVPLGAVLDILRGPKLLRRRALRVRILEVRS